MLKTKAETCSMTQCRNVWNGREEKCSISLSEWFSVFYVYRFLKPTILTSYFRRTHTHTFWCQLICIAFGSVIPFKQMKPIGNPIEWPRKKNRVEELSIHFHWIETQLKLWVVSLSTSSDYWILASFRFLPDLVRTFVRHTDHFRFNCFFLQK